MEIVITNLYLSHIRKNLILSPVLNDLRSYRGLTFGWSLHLHPFLVSASSECSGESVRSLLEKRNFVKSHVLAHKGFFVMIVEIL